MSASTTPAAVQSDPRTRDLLQRRHRTLGRHSPLFYSEPLELVRGRGVRVEDSAGRSYLDAYNNVPHVGHAHPEVARAVHEQMQRLALHTRYLNENVLDYAEQLLATFEPGLDRVAFSNSGSEANELALRVARQHTGARGVLVSDWSYHGTTSALAEVTTALAAGEPFADHARRLRVPDATGLDAAATAELLAAALREVDQAVESLDRAGHGVALVLIDPLFTTEGLVRVPDGYVDGLARRVRAAGGLVVSDEVQAGFGRTGTSMWGYQEHGIVPDLVTLGKPMGNGHPLGGTVLRADLLEEFGARNEYFNTFGGNPVSAAAGRAVLEVMRAERLRERAVALAPVLSAGLHDVAATSPGIVAVRGQGLFQGLEFVDPATGGPDGGAARAVVEGVRRAGVLISRIGRHGNVLKIRPPLAIEEADVRTLLDRLADVVAEVGTGSREPAGQRPS
ncbi:aspartate aminotransferase family protein [Kineococcus sp. SYSU DK001]|uniref:aspartate aminotransferase family protein n=1 Tax=Kineococcus sp. SYSU DK001 TaxID=3383122 RepID=UPI003D7F1505